MVNTKTEVKLQNQHISLKFNRLLSLLFSTVYNAKYMDMLFKKRVLTFGHILSKCGHRLFLAFSAQPDNAWKK